MNSGKFRKEHIDFLRSLCAQGRYLDREITAMFNTKYPMVGMSKSSLPQLRSKYRFAGKKATKRKTRIMSELAAINQRARADGKTYGQKVGEDWAYARDAAFRMRRAEKNR